MSVTTTLAQVRASESNLFQLLARVAPPAGGRPPEVMIAISNFNLIAGGQLNAWLDVRLCCKQKTVEGS